MKLKFSCPVCDYSSGSRGAIEKHIEEKSKEEGTVGSFIAHYLTR